MTADIKPHSTEPLVSVIVPAYNSELYIETAIRSVIKQQYCNWELIIIDDCSTDSTPLIVQALSQGDNRIKFTKNPVNVGAAKSRNCGLDVCNGDYVTFLDADDVWHPDKLLLQIKKIIEEKADLVYSSYAIVDGDGKLCKEAYIVPEKITFDKLLKENVIGCSTVLLSRDVAAKYRFKSEFYHEDYCLWLDILKDGYKAVGCKEVLVDWRLILNSRSYNKRNSAINRWKIYREHLNFSVFESARLFFHYIVRGIKKYR